MIYQLNKLNNSESGGNLDEQTKNKQKNNTPDEAERVKLDQIIKMLFSVSKKMLIDTLNGLFNESFNPDDVNIKVNKTATEFVPDDLEFNIIRADSFFNIEAKNKPYHFHIEYELSGNDMTIRVFEYAIQKALENQRLEGKKGRRRKKRLYLPRSLVIHFTKNKKIPDKYELEIVFPNGDSYEYTVDVMKYWNYTEKDLIAKKLYNLLPLQIFLLRAELDKVKNQQQPAASRNKAKKIIDKIFMLLNELHEQGEIISDDYSKLITGFTEILRHIDDRYNLELIGEIKMLKNIVDTKILKRANEAEKKLQDERAKLIEGVKKMLSNGEPVNKIVDYMGITEEEINGIQQTN